MEPHRLVRKASKFLRELRLGAPPVLPVWPERLAPFKTPEAKASRRVPIRRSRSFCSRWRRVAPVITVVPGSVDLVVEGPDKLADKIGRHQLMSESFDNPSLDFASTNACTIGAGPLPSGSRAGDVVLADWCGRPPQTPQTAFPVSRCWGRRRVQNFVARALATASLFLMAPEPRLYAVPEIVV